MGCYIDPKNETKEQFLKREGEEIKVFGSNLYIQDNFYPVCLVNNGQFTAAAICWNEEEFKRFTRPEDLRPKVWFLVSFDKLREVSDIEYYLSGE